VIIQAIHAIHADHVDQDPLIVDTPKVEPRIAHDEQRVDLWDPDPGSWSEARVVGSRPRFVLGSPGATSSRPAMPMIRAELL
jgi:hypothetical protein